MKPFITVFTPTYNRKENLEKCYDSLIKQTNKNFIWQIIDDGSTDDTEDLVKNWQSEKIIEIIYMKKNNGGKASCINLSLENTHTQLWVCLDSDDYFIGNAIERINDGFQKIKKNNEVCGMFALRSQQDGSPMQNKSIPLDIEFTTQSYIRYNLKIPPEYVHVFKTEIIKNYKYPIIENERFMPLSYVFDQIDKSYKYKVLHEPIMVCEYQSDGMTKNKRKLIKENPIGYRIYKRQAMLLAPSTKEKIKAAITYNTACILAKSRGNVRHTPYKLLTIICFPFGLIDYILRYSRI